MVMIMPKRKKPAEPDYVFTPSDSEKLIVQKSNPLQNLSESDLSLCEFKILDAYLGRINSHEPDKRYVRFSKGELEEILGVSRIPRAELEQRLKSLFTAVKIYDENKPNGFTYVGLFSRAEAFRDDDGLWQVDLACTPEAMEYIFNIEQLGYLRYALKNISGLSSRYSYFLFLYLMNNSFRGTWNISIAELKSVLNCKADIYEEFKFFNAKILKVCCAEINEKTNLSFEYEPDGKVGRKYTEIKFTVKSVVRLEDGEDYEEDESGKEQEPAYDIERHKGEDLMNLLAEACDFEFTYDEMTVLRDLIVDLVPGNDADRNLRRYEYLQRTVHLMNTRSKGEIRNRFMYLRKMLQTVLDG